MSTARQQTNGYLQGPDPNTFRRWDLDSSSRETSDAERSRSRPATRDRNARPQQQQAQPQSQYQPQADQVHGVSRLDRGNARRRSRGEPDSRSRSRPRSSHGTTANTSVAGGRTAGRYNNQVEDILRYISNHWTFMASTTCIPIKIALQLMDTSSLGLASESEHFHQAHRQLQNALKVIVNEHHQGFNSSIGTFHKIQTAIHNSQSRVRTLRAGLIQAKACLATQRPELKALASSSLEYEVMLQTINTIETLQLVPDELEALIREKRYLAAVDSLLEALKLIRKPELEDIGALGDLRVRLSNQEQILTDMLVEELHNHLYLKSPYCEERWKTQALAHYSQHSKYNNQYTPAAALNPSHSNNHLMDNERAMTHFLDTYDATVPMNEEPSRNAEADTFYFIQLLLESLHRMSRLDVAVDRIEERLPLEFHRLLDRTLAEVEQRHPSSTLRARTDAYARQLDSAADGTPEKKAVLDDLLSTLFAKFEAIAEAHRVLHDVTAAILKRDGVPAEEAATLNRSFRELWKLLQSEMRSLLHDHLATNAGAAGGSGRGRAGDAQDALSAANIFKTSQGRERERRKLFRLADSGGGASGGLVEEREDLEAILKSSVPGLVNASKDAARKDSSKTSDSALRALGLEPDSMNGLSDRSATGHKLLVAPSVFNMALLLPSSLTFLTNLKQILPATNATSLTNTFSIPGSTLTAFLDDFLLNVFQPQLDETLLDLCSRSMNDLDTFQPDPAWREKASRPIFKGTARFYDLMERFCVLLDALPHEMGFAALLVAQMRVYYDRCFSWSRGLMQRIGMGTALAQKQDEANSGPPTAEPTATVKMRMAAELATSGEVCDVVLEILTLSEADTQTKGSEASALAQKEADFLLKLAKRRELEDADLILDRKTLAALCTLHVSMKWLAAKCKNLRFLSPWALDTANTQAHRRRTWNDETSKPDSNILPSGPYLPLDGETAENFDAVITSFTELSTLILRTLHIDLRLHLLQGIYKSLDTTYALGQPYNDPNPHIATLSQDLASYNAQLTTHILPAQNTFVTAHLDKLANTALTSLVSSVPAMDAPGNSRISLNILVLQQSLKSLQPSADLSSSARFYALGAEGPKAIVEKGVDEGFPREDLKALTRLCWVEDRDEPMLGDMEGWVMKLGGWPKRTQSLSRKGGRGRGRRGAKEDD